jgi:hypothetical protein
MVTGKAGEKTAVRAKIKKVKSASSSRKPKLDNQDRPAAERRTASD